MPTVVIHGITEVRHALSDLASQAPKQVAFVNAKAADIVKVAAAHNAPKGPHEGSGAIVPIAQSLAVVSTPTKASVTAGGPMTPHAAGSEFGGYIPRRGLKGLRRRAKKAIRAAHGRGLTHLHRHSFLIPAIEAKRGEVIALYERMLGDLITRFEAR